MPLTEKDRIEMLEALAKDESLKATQRLRALEELGRMESRREAAGPKAPVDEEMPPDPMADLDEMENRRRANMRRAS